MQRFFVPIIFIGSLGTIGMLVIFFTVPPTAPSGELLVKNVSLFFMMLWLSIFAIATWLTYLIIRIVHPNNNARLLLRRSIRRGALISTGAIGVLLLRLINAYNLLNFILLLAVIVLLEISFTSVSGQKTKLENDK